jgi:hypothetical protein
MLKRSFLLLIVVLTTQTIMAQEVFNLYTEKIPNAKETPELQTPQKMVELG